MIQITAVRLTGGIGHEHITDLMWRSEATPAGLTSRPGLVDWVSANSSNRAVIHVGPRTVQVEVVRPPTNRPTFERAPTAYGPTIYSPSRGSEEGGAGVLVVGRRVLRTDGFKGHEQER